MQAWLRKQKPGGTRLPFAGLGDSALDDPRAGFKNFGDFALAVRNACQPGRRPDDRLSIMAKAASGMGEDTGSAGGFLVPTEFIQRILENYTSADNAMVSDALRMAYMMSKFGNTLTPKGRDDVMTKAACEKYQCMADSQKFRRLLTLASAFWSRACSGSCCSRSFTTGLCASP